MPVLGAAAGLLAAFAVREALADRSPSSAAARRAAARRIDSLASAASRLGLESRLARAGLGATVGPQTLLVAKLAGAGLGALAALAAAPAAPGRLSPLVVVALPVAGFLGPDAWLERRAKARLRSLRSALPDALDLFAVGAASGRAPGEAFREVSGAGGALGRELAIARADLDCGAPQREALAGLRRRAPVAEVASMCAAMERSRRHGSPLSEQLAAQATAIRRDQRRRVEEGAARAAPKIQLAVALLLVPSVLLMIAAALLANMDRFLAGL